MQYKTIVLELLQQQPELYQQLNASNSLILTLNRLANQLRDNHLQILEQLQLREPHQSLLLLKSEAMEIAVNQLQETLQRGPSLEQAETLSLDAAMAFLKSQAPPG